MIIPYPVFDKKEPTRKAKLILVAYNGGKPLLLPDIAKADGVIALDLKSQAHDIAITTDRSRGPPHDTRTPFMCDPELRFLALSVSHQLDYHRRGRPILPETLVVPMHALLPFTSRCQRPTTPLVTSAETPSSRCPTDWSVWARSAITLPTKVCRPLQVFGPKLVVCQTFPLRASPDRRVHHRFLHVSIIDLNPLPIRRSPTLKWDVSKFDARQVPEGFDVRRLDRCFANVGLTDYMKYDFMPRGFTPSFLVDGGFATEEPLEANR